MNMNIMRVCRCTYKKWYQVFKGAVLGILLLQDIYEVVSKILESVPYKENKVSDTNYKSRCSSCKINAVDLVRLAPHAFRLNWYENMLLFMRKAVKLFREDTLTNTSTYPPNFDKAILSAYSLAQNLTLHQQMKHSIKVGSNHLLLSTIRYIWSKC